jgi:hypothetical protein
MINTDIFMILEVLWFQKKFSQSLFSSRSSNKRNAIPVYANIPETVDLDFFSENKQFLLLQFWTLKVMENVKKIIVTFETRT